MCKERGKSRCLDRAGRRSGLRCASTMEGKGGWTVEGRRDNWNSHRRAVQRDSNATPSPGVEDCSDVPIVGDKQVNVSPTATAHDNN